MTVIMCVKKMQAKCREEGGLRGSEREEKREYECEW